MMENGGGITFDVRYTMGMAKIMDGDELELEEDPDVKTNNISFMLGYSF